MKVTSIIAATAVAAVALPASAAINWASWNSASVAGATGTIGAVTVAIDGPLHNAQINNVGTNYWLNGGSPWAAYDGVSNVPGNVDFIAPNGDGVTHTITFSSAVTNPYIAVISLGRTNVPTQWTFGAPVSIVDQGQGFFGNGVFTLSGNSVTAGEAHGILRLTGTFTSVTLRTDTTEFWSGLTIGTAVPEPATWAMMILGFGLVGASLRRRTTVTA
ncbi:PEPxxWA-CTERM sorting domain-containing protein [Sandaracinobacteroides saxicola]|uniref:PEP-CTERM sorting domain-containing protein n=1 Tax=Sandaracinobacteroides saxicola TaxID=2759707 RepID=A0A7G5IJI5_9SPHN|nr:PEPxxWA-CTERM sorting domain-containing protein [Sandaracinobacteroides saxicola]QMW23527.1 PEP-CTERM sorting domain-containing protein [Sandaracinobacteroides saxicola]